jgi:hypothetical protein
MAEGENGEILGEGEVENPTTPEGGEPIEGGTEGGEPETGNEAGGESGTPETGGTEPNDDIEGKIEKSRVLLSELDSSSIVLAKLEQMKLEDEDFTRELTLTSKGLVAINLPQGDKAEIFELIQTYYLLKVEGIKEEFEQL